MSYSLISPPPTGAPLPVVAVANENMPYYAPASGGGGGGGGVNPAGISTNAVAAATTSKLNLFGGAPGTALSIDSAASTISISGGNIEAPASDLLISSINGASPAGGGVNPNPSFSSITLSTNANLNAIGGAIFQVGGNDVGINIQNSGTAAINEIGMISNGAASAVYPSLTGNATYVATTAPAGNVSLIMLAGDNDGGALIGGAINNGNSTLTIISGGDLVLKTTGATSISTLTVSSINGQAPGGAAISTFDVASVSSLTVSSINGQAPGGGAIANVSTPSLSTNFVLTTGGPPVVPMTSTMALTTGHLYSMSWTDNVNVVGGNAPNSYLQYSLSTPTGFLPLDLVPGALLSSFVVSTLTNHTYQFNAPGPTVQLVLSQNAITSTIVDLYPGQDIILRDLGPVV